MIHVENFFAMETDVIIDNFSKLHESAMIKTIGSLQAHIVYISGKVVKFVGIDARFSIGDNVIQENRNKGLCMVARLLWPCYEVSYVRDIRGIDINLKLIDQMFKEHDGPSFMLHEWILACSGTAHSSWKKVMIEQMGVRAVTEVMAQTSQFHESHGMLELTFIIIAQSCGGVAWIIVQSMNKSTRQVRDA